MKVAIGLVTCNRLDLLKRTLASIEGAGHPYSLEIVDNGSTDATAEYTASLGAFRNPGPDLSVGRGFNFAAGLALSSYPDLVVLSGDDLEYRPDWLASLVEFWEYAPRWLGLLGTYMEPRFRWNAPYGAIECGPKGKPRQRALLRFNLGCAVWTFRAEDWPLIGRIPETLWQGGDKEVCKRLQEKHRMAIGALDLAVHLGETCSLLNPEGWANAGDIGPERRLWGV